MTNTEEQQRRGDSIINAMVERIKRFRVELQQSEYQMLKDRSVSIDLKEWVDAEMMHIKRTSQLISDCARDVKILTEDIDAIQH